MNSSSVPSTRSRRLSATRGSELLWITAGVLLLATVLRLGLIAMKWPELAVDRDAYLGIARTLLAGDGFCTPGTNSPTAFRPPLYPVLLAISYGIADLAGIALLQLVAGVLATAGAIAVARQFGLTRWSWLAGAVVAIDPLLLQYTTQPMTEVVCTAICIWMVWAWARCLERPTAFGALLAGLTFGAAVLCRPSLLPFPLTLAVLLLLFQRRRGVNNNAKPSSRFAFAARPLLLAFLGVLCVLPWGIRNKFVFGHWKFTTTHGGYTVLLGNNPVFYKAVVQLPWGVTWGDYDEADPLSQTSWYNNLQKQLDDAGLQTEFERDAAQYKLARQAIFDSPGLFVRSCLLRAARFWWPVPLGTQAESLSPLVVWGVGLFYSALYVAAVIGFVRVLRAGEHRAGWLVGLALIATLMTVHLIYWSNARMRAPLIPVLATAAVAVLPRSRNT